MNLLVDIIPPKARRYVYGTASLVLLGYGAWQAADGDWRALIGVLIGGPVAALAHANTNPEDPQQ